MSKVLGLDLGTNSIGWAVVEKEKGEETKLLDKGVLIFTEGVKSEKGIESSRAAARTEKRSIRKTKFRRKLRKYETLKILATEGMCPLALNEVLEWRKSGFKRYPTNEEFLKWLKTDDNLNKNPYKFRNHASREKLNKLDLGRALYHMAQRRGFWSNRLDKSDEGIIESHKQSLYELFDEVESRTKLQIKLDEYFEEVKEKKNKDLDAGDQEIKKLYNFFIKQFKSKELTVSELINVFKEKLNDRKSLGAVKGAIADLSDLIKENDCETLGQYFWNLYQKGEKIRDNYTDREKHYLYEFELICKVQELDEDLIKKLNNAIFYQRPLKSQKGLVGKCSLEPSKSRCPVSHPDFEEFRMLSFINNIKVQNSEGKKEFLTKEQRRQIQVKFFRKSKAYFDFEDIAKELKIDVGEFNYRANTTVSGNPTSAALKLLIGEDWKTAVFENVNSKGKKVTYNYQDLWHVLFTFDSDEKLLEFAKNQLGLSAENSRKFSRINLKKDYASLSLKAINKINPYLRDGLLYSHAVFMANMAYVVIEERWGNKEDRELIQNEIKKIIDNHQSENRQMFVVNSCIKNCKDNNFSYSKESENALRNDLEKEFIKDFGEKTWENKEGENDLFSEAFDSFIRCLKSDKKGEQFLTIKRIDEKVIQFLDDHDLLKDENKMYHPSDLESFKFEIKNGQKVLGSPVTGSIKNPMAMRAMFQLKKIVNTLIEGGQIDEFTHINIELARELNDANKRKAILNWQKNREKKKQEYRKAIIDLYSINKDEKGIVPTDEDILKYELYIEQNKQCLYTEGEKNAFSISDVIGTGATAEIEHTVPRSQSYDNSMENLTLSHKRANNLKSNKIPFEIGDGGNGLASHEVILKRIEHWKKAYENLDDKIKQKLRATKAATTKEQKDRIIQQRHELKLEYNYWKGKYDKFTREEVPAGFAKRQLTDIGIISKYSRAYLKSVFPRVYSVKGTMVAEFRKAWGLHDKDEKGNYIAKDRGNHTHHCKDAITIACMDKYKYDRMAEYWADNEKKGIKNKRTVLKKPWETFAEDVRHIEDEILVVHHTKDVVPIQTKKKIRKRGKIQYGKDGKSMYQQGDTIRGSLHKDTFYGAIASKDEKGAILKDKEGNIVPAFVERVKLENLKKAQIDKIVDEGVKEIIKQAEISGVIKFGQTTSITDERVWMNKEKGVEIKKVRVYAHIKTPLLVKEQRDKKEGKEYKHHFYASNDENYCMAIYAGKDKKGAVKRTYEMINMMDAAEYFKLSNKNSDLPLVPEENKGLKFKGKLMAQKLVLFYNESEKELWDLDHEDLVKRLYRVRKMSGDGRITFQYHQEARNDEGMKEDYKIKFNETPPSSLTNGVSKLEFENGIQAKYLLSPGNMNMIIEGVDFKISPLGKIEKLSHAKTF